MTSLYVALGLRFVGLTLTILAGVHLFRLLSEECRRGWFRSAGGWFAIYSAMLAAGVALLATFR